MNQPESLTDKRKTIKPRVRFCWDCGKKLYGNHFAEKLIDGHIRILHKGCAKAFDDPRDHRLTGIKG